MSDITPIRILIYTLDKCTIQTRIVSFLDHEKSLKEVDSFRLALFINVDTENPHCPCPKYGMIYRPDMYNLQVKKSI